VSGEEVFCRTVIGGPLLSYKGLALPGVKIFADAVSDTDLEFVAFALQEGVDAFGVSFAETADDILKVKGFAQKEGNPPMWLPKSSGPRPSKISMRFFPRRMRS
jgi:pyruvate kinase